MAKDTKKRRILIAEDEGYISALYKELLEEEGYDVEIAESGNRAYKEMLDGGYDLVLLDMLLPEMDGVDILKKLAENHPKTPNKKVIITSNLNREAISRKLGKTKVDGVLVKSDLTPDQLLEKIKSYLR